jgi:subtilisin family serine protease
MKNLNTPKKVLFLSLFVSVLPAGVFAQEEYIVEINPMVAKKLNLKEQKYKTFTVKKMFTAFNRELALIEAPNEKTLKSLTPNYFSYMEKNQKYTRTAIAKDPARPGDLTGWDPKPVMTNDASFTRLWGVLNFGQKLQKTGIKQMDAGVAQAWPLTKDAKRVLVGVMDTGVDFKHPDLAPNIWTRKDSSGKIFHGYNTFSDKLDVVDDSYFTHGTHVSGTIAAVPNNKKGIAGIAWNATIVPIKIFQGDSATDSVAVLKGLNWIYNNPEIKVVNHSWIGAGESKLVSEAFRKLDDAGVINVFGSGNSGIDIDKYAVYPGALKLKHGIIVAAHDSRGLKPEFSNYGSTNIDIAAPGVDIYSTCLKTKFCSLFGTSMAAPHVTGAVAVLLGMFPDLTAEQIKNKIIDGGTTTPSLVGVSRNAKRLNLLGAINN